MLRRPHPDRRRSKRTSRERRWLAPQERERLDKLAADKRDYRSLIEGGGAVLKGVPVTDINALTEALLDLHWLDENKSEDRAALVAAVGAVLDDIAKPYRRPPLSDRRTDTRRTAP